MLVNAKSLPCARFLIFVVLMLALGFKKAQINNNKHIVQFAESVPSLLLFLPEFYLSCACHMDAGGK